MNRRGGMSEEWTRSLNESRGMSGERMGERERGRKGMVAETGEKGEETRVAAINTFFHVLCSGENN